MVFKSSKEAQQLKNFLTRSIQALAFLGVPRTPPIVGLFLEMNWLELRPRTQLRIIRMHHRLVCMLDNLLTKQKQKISGILAFNTWTKELKEVLQRNDLIALT